ncbi:tyrosine-type recombinase/integrase [Pseudomonas sp. App30]|uniref:tyrosine-type recombinase/integrase n=1 Tax=Pseudomonas sp. App30 TaxID=3068990 RepID=UPI003A802E47
MNSDGQGLYLKITAQSSGSWIYRFKVNGKMRDMGLGTIADIGLAEARDLAADARKNVKSGIDPLQMRILASSPPTEHEKPTEKSFQEMAEDYVEAHRPGWKNAKHAQQWANTLKTYAYPVIGSKSVAEVETADLLKILNPIWTVKPETASRVRNRIELVLSAAKALGLRAGENPALWRGHLDKLLAKRKISDKGNHPALAWERLPDFMAELDKHSDMSAMAVKVTILCALRTTEAIGATWDEIDFDNKIWSIPAQRMKASRAHRVPLSSSVIKTLLGLRKVHNNPFIFPGQKPGRPLSNMAMLLKLRRMDESFINAGGIGWRNAENEVITMHGFRSSFRDWAAEATHFSETVPEMALAHKIKNATEAAYRRGDLLEKRRELMEEWSLYAKTGKRLI